MVLDGELDLHRTVIVAKITGYTVGMLISRTRGETPQQNGRKDVMCVLV